MRTCALRGVEAVPVTVEIEVTGGLPGMFIVGMVDTAVQEARHRVRSAIKAAGFDMPSDRIVVNLAPADLRKSGSAFDLPIALAYLIATGQVPRAAFESMIAVGELGLEGSVHAVDGLIAYAQCARQHGLSLLSAPVGMGLVTLDGLEHSCISHLGRLHTGELDVPDAGVAVESTGRLMDYCDVVGQDNAVRAMLIAAAGGHGAMLVGPPGSGKSMLARRLPSILPPLSPEEQVESAIVHSVAGYDVSDIAAGVRPFRSPHHSATIASLVGGGNPLRPGEASLAHNGVLFLDELGEFSAAALQGLRQPLEDGEIALCRADGRCVFPARFQLIAASNPCPCGYLGDRDIACKCSDAQVNRYQSKLGGPLRDRIDLTCEVCRVDPSKVMGTGHGESSATLREKVLAARERSSWRDTTGKALSATVPAAVIEACGLSDKQRLLLEDIARKHHLSGRGIIRTLRVSRTIADIEQSDDVKDEHLLEALMFRGVGGGE